MERDEAMVATYTKAVLIVIALASAVIADYRRGPRAADHGLDFGVAILDPCRIPTANGDAEIETGLCP